MVVKKAKAYFEKVKKPLFVEDVSVVFNCLGQLPGPYMKDFCLALGYDGLTQLVSHYQDKTAVATTTLAYIDSQQLKTFTGSIKGKITPKPIGNEGGFGWDPIFIPDGYTKTFAQMTAEEKNLCSMRALALREFKKWLDSKSHRDD